jgi:hypothetical protein
MEDAAGTPKEESMAEQIMLVLLRFMAALSVGSLVLLFAVV